MNAPRPPHRGPRRARGRRRARPRGPAGRPRGPVQGRQPALHRRRARPRPRDRGPRRARSSSTSSSTTSRTPSPARSRAPSRLGVSLVDVHGLGGRAMIEAAVGALPAMGTRLLAITILTSHDDETLDEIGVNGSMVESVRRLAQLAKEAGADGVVASPHEVALDPRGLRARLPDRDARHPAGGRGPGRPGPRRRRRPRRSPPARTTSSWAGRSPRPPTPRPPPTRSCARWRRPSGPERAVRRSTPVLDSARKTNTTRSPGPALEPEGHRVPGELHDLPRHHPKALGPEARHAPELEAPGPGGSGLDERRLDPVLPAASGGRRAGCGPRAGRPPPRSRRPGPLLPARRARSTMVALAADAPGARVRSAQVPVLLTIDLHLGRVASRSRSCPGRRPGRRRNFAHAVPR